jgi:small subunit ribosomal protein S3
MGQKINPTGFRTGVTIGWKSRWFAPKSNYGEFLVEDARIRKFLDDRLNRQPPFGGVSSIEIERTREEVKVILRTARPGIVIGPKGAEVENLKSALEDLTNRRVNISIIEVRNPDLDAQLVAEGISEQLKRRSSFRRAMKQRAESTLQAGAKGVKIQISGRLGGAEMSRTEQTIRGSIPLHTLEADVDYGFVHCFTTYGAIGVKVWVYRGMFGEQTEEAAPAPRGRSERRGRRSRSGGAGGRPQRDGGARKPDSKGSAQTQTPPRTVSEPAPKQETKPQAEAPDLPQQPAPAPAAQPQPDSTETNDDQA